MTERKPKPCNFFNLPGGCRHGQACKFVHTRDSNGGTRAVPKREWTHRRDGARPEELGGVKLFADKASPVQLQEFEQLNCGQVAGWLKRTFKLNPEMYLDIRRSESNFQVTLEPSVATNILRDQRKLRFNGIPVRVMILRGQAPQQAPRTQQGTAPLERPRDEQVSGPPGASDGVTKFWRRMEVALEADRRTSGTEQLKLHEAANRALWLSCWAVAAAGAPGNCEVLLRVLLNAPAKADIAPPAADVVQVLCRLVASLEKRSEWLGVLGVLELVVDALETRLAGYEARVHDVEAVLAHASSLQETFLPTMMRVMSGVGAQGMMRSGKLMGRFTAIMPKYSDALQRARNALARDAPSMETHGALSPWLGWQQPTIGWLMSDASKESWLRAPGLATSYEDAASYCETLQRLTALLTFYHGAGAISPRCKHQQPGADGKCCAEPLLSPIRNGRLCTQRLTHGEACKNSAAFTCPRFNHSDAVCARCLKRLQIELMGRPHQKESRCSTDIYDAVVQQEFSRREGQVFVLGELKSRKPPKIEPNWRHSYRLASSQLCAVGRLDMAHAPLQPSLALHWAEIVPVSTMPGNDEGAQRSRGRLAVRLLGRSDCSVLQAADLDVGTRVFIIDLRVFAPEVVPVLATYASPTQIEDFESIGFVNSLIGRAPRRPHQLTVAMAAGLQERITHALQNSEIDLLDRLPPPRRQRLTNDICALAQRANLYGTQLEAFAEGLGCAVHCTLGPPGTGKSYTGVQQIVALDLIRDALLDSDIKVGPILLNSYKNHALDEMVKDVLAHPLLAEKMRKPGALIRCGKPDDFELKRFTEQRSVEETVWDETLNQRVQRLQLARHFTAELHDLADHLDVHALALKPGADGQARLLEWRPGSQKASPAQVLTAAVGLMQHLVEARAAARQQQEEGGEEGSEDGGEDNGETQQLVLPSREAFKLLKLIDCSLPLQQPLRGECVQELAAGAEHWVDGELLKSLGNERSNSRVCSLLAAYLIGLEPPPRCQAAEEDAAGANVDEMPFCCLAVVHKKGAYCWQLHGCRHPEGCDCRRTTVESVAQIPFCNEHRCRGNDGVARADACHKVSEPGGSFCADHACRACVYFHKRALSCGNLGVLSGGVLKATPFACEEHQCKTAGCIRLMGTPFVSFCTEHCCGACVHERSGDVRQRLPGRKFCDAHTCEVEGCLNRRLPNTEAGAQTLCDAHACISCVGPRRRIDPLCPASRLCDQHRCMFQIVDVRGQQMPCWMVRLPGSFFCQSHSCRVCCLALPNVLQEEIKPAVYAFPRNVCEWHPLCSFMGHDGEQCSERADLAGQYCERHQRFAFRPARPNPAEAAMIEQKCHGMTSKGKPCKTKGQAPASRQFYCNAHLDQAPAESSEEDSEYEEGSEDEDEEDSVEDFVHVGDGEWAGAQPAAGRQDFPPLPTPLPPPPVMQPPMPAVQPPDTQPPAVQPPRAGKQHATEQPPAPHADGSDSSDDEDLRLAIATSLSSGKVHSQSGSSSAHDGPGPSEAAGPSDATVAPDAAGTAAADDAAAVAVEEPDAEEGPRYDMNPDEMEFDEEELFGMNEEQQRLQQVLGDDLHADANAELEEPEEDATRTAAGGGAAEEADVEALAAATRAWAWDAPLNQRWAEVAAFLRAVAGMVTKLRSLAQPHLEEARRGRAEAAADAFKKARLIAATVVGGVRRLEALRAAEPFAAVVEEACEVMEPTLMAVLSVRSLRKLELVGDHRQLPAAIPNAWFNLESAIPSMKVSLFERLVTGASGRGARSQGGAPTDGGVAPCTVLDEQRRMRPAISDLTRGHYSDLVAIQDHPCTVAQLIGDRVKGASKVQLVKERESWAGRGELAPGMGVQEFFWDLPNNGEGRPTAGLSACNYKEADAVASLVRHLTLCGVPCESISIITPYKGQKGAIQKALQKTGVLRQPRRNDKGQMEFDDSMVVSTVDRYQGDENDIIILSLVRTRPGNRFVALHNRFVVATSRARIGFYIVGTVDAVAKSGSGSKGPEHWCGLIDHLKEGRRPPAEGAAGSSAQQMQGSGSEEASMCEPCYPEESAPQRRVGSCGVGKTFPICCPRHPETLLEVTCGCVEPGCPKVHFPRKATDALCTESCTTTLKWCGHFCAVPCHSPVSVPHTKPDACAASLQRPCAEHQNEPLTCGTLFKASHLTKGSMAKALESGFECDMQVEYQRPECQHKVEMTCARRQRLLAGEEELPTCKVQVPDFYHPACNHVMKKPKCYERRQWEMAPPRCMKMITHVRPCGCTVQLRCFELGEAAASTAPCMMDVNMHRPRCSHQLSLRCYERTALLERWQASHGSGASAPGDASQPVLVSYAEAYGPAEWELSRQHQGTVLLSHGTSSVPVGLVPHLPIEDFVGVAEGQPADALPIGQPVAAAVAFRTAIPECTVRVNYRAECGHVIANVPCNVAFRWADPTTPDAPPPCKAMVSVESILCGHEVMVECAVATSMEWQSAAPVGAVAALPEGRLMDLPVFSPFVEKAISGLCSQQVIVLRNCEHATQVPCKRLLTMVRVEQQRQRQQHQELPQLPRVGAGLPRCKELVSKQLEECGHEVKVECSKKHDATPIHCNAVVHTPFVFSCGKHKKLPGTCHKLRKIQLDNPACEEKVHCNLFRCNHPTIISCRLEPAVSAAQPGVKLEPAGVVVAGEEYCMPCADAPQCDVGVTFRDVCGHERPGTPCDLAFRWAANPDQVAREAPCFTAVQLQSPLCGHTLELKCHEADTVRLLELWPGAALWRPSVTRSKDNGATLEMIVVDCDSSRPELEELSVAERRLLTCGAESVVQRPCGHEEIVPCIDALKALDTGRCSQPVSLLLPCGHGATLPCHTASLVESDAITHWCSEQVVKKCGTCGINECTVDCSRLDVHCGREVVAALPCGHEVRWDCGDDVDPRSDRTKACAQCVLQQWQAARPAPADAPVDELQRARKAQQMQWVVEQLRSFAEAQIPNAIEVHELPVLERRLRGLAGAHEMLLKIGCDLLQSKITNDELWEAEKAAPPMLSDLGCFDVVFCPLTPAQNDEVRVNQRFAQRDTNYGLGASMLLLTADNLKQINKDNLVDQNLRICVGVAFRFSALKETKPFRKKPPGQAPQQGGGKRKGKKTAPTAESELVAKANKERQRQLVQGMDYVVPSEGRGQRIYWVNGAVVPLCVATIRLFHACGGCGKSFVWSDGGPATGHDFLCSGCQRDCCICFEPHAANAGLACDSAEQHFMCDECLEGHTLHASSFEALEVFRRNDGVKCPVPGCAAPRFAEGALAQRLNKQTFDHVMQAKGKIQEQQIVAEVEARVAAEAAREAAESDRLRRKNHITDKILTVACPRCGQAFDEFDGCMALTCSRAGCGCGFCAICQKDCGSDAHQHMRTCPENTDQTGYFATTARYHAMLKVRISKVLRAYLDGLTREQRQHALEDIQVELRHRGLDPREFRNY